MVIYTIRSVFPTCRIFRENPPPELVANEPDFTNMVIFCKKSTNAPLQFRQPNKADYLYSRARKAFLYPQFEIPESAFMVMGNPEAARKMILKKGQTKELEKEHTRSAVGHWSLMRTVLPDNVWQDW